MKERLEAYLKVESAGNAVFTDKGDTFACISTRAGAPQIWQRTISQGSWRQRSFGNERIWRISAHPQTGSILFCMDVGGNENEQIFMLAPDADAPVNLSQDPASRHYLAGLSCDGKTVVYSSNARTPETFDIWTMDIQTGEKRLVVQNSDHYNTPAAGGLSPDGRYVLYNKLLGASNSAMWMADLTTGATVKIPADDVVAAYDSPVWRSDSQGFYVLTDRNSEFAFVAYYDVKTAALTEVYRTDWDVENLALSADDRYLAMIVNADGYSALRILDTKTGALLNIPEPPKGVISYYETLDFSRDGHKLLFSLSSGKRPKDIWMLDLDADSLRRVTDSRMEGVDPDELVEPQLCRFQSFDGLSVPYWLYVPAGKKAEHIPLVIEIHGGPEGQEKPAFDAVIQYWLLQGIAVVAPNVRGSTGYGKTYQSLDDVEKRLDSVHDIDALVQHLIDTGVADEKAIAVMGMSYGGFMTLSCAARYPHRWACAVDTVGMYNLVSFLENTAPYRRSHRESEYGTLAHDRETLYRVSPISRIDDLTAPLMVIHGRNDPRVPFSETEQVVEHLRQKGVKVEFLPYDDEGHGIIKLKNKLDCYPKVAAFLRKNLGIE